MPSERGSSIIGKFREGFLLEAVAGDRTFSSCLGFMMALVMIGCWNEVAAVSCEKQW